MSPTEPDQLELELSPASPDTTLVNPTLVANVQLVPGAAVETLADYEANEDLRALKVADTEVPETPREIDTTSALANLACRNNIVGDGPGTVGEALV